MSNWIDDQMEKFDRKRAVMQAKGLMDLEAEPDQELMKRIEKAAGVDTDDVDNIRMLLLEVSTRHASAITHQCMKNLAHSSHCHDDSEAESYIAGYLIGFQEAYYYATTYGPIPGAEPRGGL